MNIKKYNGSLIKWTVLLSYPYISYIVKKIEQQCRPNNFVKFKISLIKKIKLLLVGLPLPSLNTLSKLG